MKTLILILLTVTISFASPLPNNSIVKIFSSISTPDYKYPWQTSKISNYTGSGAKNAHI